MYGWSVKWRLEFNTQKCRVLEMGKSKRRPSWTYNMGEVIAKRREENDLGVLIQDNLQLDKHMKQIFDSTFRILSNIRVAFHYMDKEMMNKMVQPRFEYAAVAWSPHMKKPLGNWRGSRGQPQRWCQS